MHRELKHSFSHYAVWYRVPSVAIHVNYNNERIKTRKKNLFFV